MLAPVVKLLLSDARKVTTSVTSKEFVSEKIHHQQKLAKETEKHEGKSF